MYRAKALGRNRQEIFDVGMRARAMDRLNLENDIRLGVERGEFRLCYQPIVALANEQLVSLRRCSAGNAATDADDAGRVHSASRRDRSHRPCRHLVAA